MQFSLFTDRRKTDEVPTTGVDTVAKLGLKDGSPLYIVIAAKEGKVVDKVVEKEEEYVIKPAGKLRAEDEVDKVLSKMGGIIVREYNPRLCPRFHARGSRGGCQNCWKLNPHDAEYQEYLDEHGIRHMSFHAYVSKLQKEKNLSSLVNIDMKQRKKCANHNPRISCDKCRTPPLTLMRQV